MPTIISQYSGLPNKLVRAANGVDYAYRDIGPEAGGVPLVLFQHFRGNLDNWDPRADRRTGHGPPCRHVRQRRSRRLHRDDTGQRGADGPRRHRLHRRHGTRPVDLLGFSIGSFIAQQVALTRPVIVRRLVLASAAPQGAAGMHGWAPEVIGAIGTPATSPGEYLDVFFARSSSSRQAGQEAAQRMYARTEDRDAATTWATREAQYDAVCAWGIPDHAQLQRLSCLQMPVFVANGDSDPMILPHYSYLLAGLIPQARVKIYPDSAHGFLFQLTRSLPLTSRPS
jgi:pimeloyl-ACP methyl ester carboxylesterase